MRTKGRVRRAARNFRRKRPKRSNAKRLIRDLFIYLRAGVMCLDRVSLSHGSERRYKCRGAGWGVREAGYKSAVAIT